MSAGMRRAIASEASGAGGDASRVRESPRKLATPHSARKAGFGSPVSSYGRCRISGLRTPDKAFIGHIGLSESPIQCRRALSMENLSPLKKAPRAGERGGSEKQRCDAKESYGVTAPGRMHRVPPKKLSEKQASQRVYQVLLLHSWRLARDKDESLNNQCTQTDAQVSDFQKQVEALMQFLNTEKSRMAVAARDIQGKMEELDNTTFELEKLLNLKSAWENEVVNLEIRLTKMQSKHDGDAVDFQNMQEHSAKKEKQLCQERNTLNLLRNENKILDSKMIKQEQRFRAVEAVLKKLEAKIPILRQQFTDQTKLLAQANNDRDESRKSLQEVLTGKSERLVALIAGEDRRNVLLRKIQDLDGEIWKKSNEQNTLLEILEEKRSLIGYVRSELVAHQVREMENSWRNYAKLARARVESSLPYVRLLLTQISRDVILNVLL